MDSSDGYYPEYFDDEGYHEDFGGYIPEEYDDEGIHGFDGDRYDDELPEGRYYEDGGELPGGFWHVQEYGYP